MLLVVVTAVVAAIVAAVEEVEAEVMAEGLQAFADHLDVNLGTDQSSGG